MSYEYSMVMEDAALSAWAFGGASFFSNGLIQIAVYVFTALSLYTIAMRRGISKPWLAWVPVVNVWILGSLSDQYRYVVRGENKSKRKWLLGLSLVQAVLYLIVVVLAIVLAGNVFFGMMNQIGEHQLMSRVMGPVLSLLGVSVPMIALAIAKTILYYLALYDVYTSCERKNNVIYLVLSIIPGVSTVAKPLFLFLCRDKDEGMPPRRQEESACIPEEPVQEYQEPEAPAEEVSEATNEAQ